MHDHSHGHHHDHDHHHGDHEHFHLHARVGHNRPRQSVQWQTPHQPEGEALAPPDREADLDLVETSFAEGFARSSDPTSFLRLAYIPFVGVTADGEALHLLRVEIDGSTDVGSISPLLGGEGVRYDPLPATMTSHRRRLNFVYHDGKGLRRLDFAAARLLTDNTAPSSFAVADEG
ncbi:MAG TPA: hypothetical protein PK286_03095 [Devosia sp.]|nr:hypothetical protein [Devosia sp.]